MKILFQYLFKHNLNRRILLTILSVIAVIINNSVETYEVKETFFYNAVENITGVQSRCA